MGKTNRFFAASLALFTSFVAAQQGVLTNGNSELPACAQSCTYLQQAAQACGGVSASSQTIWNCFCQSSYLRTLSTSDAGVCDSVCTNPTDSQQVSTWYKTNCGSDDGASEHPDGGTVTVTASSSSTSAPATAAATSAAATAGGSSSNTGSGTSTYNKQTGDWWSTHYKWIIMLAVLVVALPLIALVAVCLRRRHDRKQDEIRGGFNAGITTRSAGGPTAHLNDSGNIASPGVDGSGGNTPARTRDAFMPYGYGYNRSESRLGSRQAVNEQQRGSPLARGGTAGAEMEKGVDVDSPGSKAPAKKSSRRVLIRERSATDSIEMEKQ